jgi:hypothetical protein
MCISALPRRWRLYPPTIHVLETGRCFLYPGSRTSSCILATAHLPVGRCKSEINHLGACVPCTRIGMPNRLPSASEYPSQRSCPSCARLVEAGVACEVVAVRAVVVLAAPLPHGKEGPALSADMSAVFSCVRWDPRDNVHRRAHGAPSSTPVCTTLCCHHLPRAEARSSVHQRTSVADRGSSTGQQGFVLLQRARRDILPHGRTLVVLD